MGFIKKINNNYLAPLHISPASLLLIIVNILMLVIPFLLYAACSTNSFNYCSLFKVTPDPDPDPNPNPNPNLIGNSKFIIAVLLLYISAVLIPSIKYVYTRRQAQKNFINYVHSRINNTLNDFGQFISFSIVKEELDTLKKSDPGVDISWLSENFDENNPIPEYIVESFFGIFLSSQENYIQQGYYPTLLYTCADSNIFDHEHPVWAIDHYSSEIFEFFSTEQEFVESAEGLYKGSLKGFIKNNNDIKNRRRWCSFAFKVHNSGIKHYKSALEFYTIIGADNYNKNMLYKEKKLECIIQKLESHYDPITNIRINNQEENIGVDKVIEIIESRLDDKYNSLPGNVAVDFYIAKMQAKRLLSPE